MSFLFRSKFKLPFVFLLSSSYIYEGTLASEQPFSGYSSSTSSTPCKFRVGNHEVGAKVYDLCPLLQGRRFILPSTGKDARRSDSTVHASWRAFDSNVNTSEPSTFVLELLSGVDSKLQSTRPTAISFICDPSIDDSEPTSASDARTFVWRSKHACPRSVDPRDSDVEAGTVRTYADEVPAQPKEDKNDDEKDGEGDKDNFANPNPSYSARRKAAIVILVLGVITLLTIYLIQRPPPALISFTETYIRPSLARVSPHLPHINWNLSSLSSLPHIAHMPTISSQTFKIKSLKPFGKRPSRTRNRYSFRVGENRLVQWASEDAYLLNEPGNGEEDFMVNEFDAEGEYDLERGEAYGENGAYVPLSESVGRKNYGTAGLKA